MNNKNSFFSEILDHKKFLEQQKQLLLLENQAERDEYNKLRENLTAKEISKLGIVLLGLRIKEIRNSYYNQVKYVFVLPDYGGRKKSKEKLERHRFKNGDTVGIFTFQKNCMSKEPLRRGIV